VHIDNNRTGIGGASTLLSRSLSRKWKMKSRLLNHKALLLLNTPPEADNVSNIPLQLLLDFPAISPVYRPAEFAAPPSAATEGGGS
jgi:hypothetical protein